MSQPPSYQPSYSFTDFSSGSPSSQPPGVKLDEQFNAISETMAALIHNLSRIQRDDTALANKSVGVDQLAASALALMLDGGFQTRGEWSTATPYVGGDFYSDDNKTYLVMVAHISTAIATDIASGKVVGPVFYPEAQQFSDIVTTLASVNGAGTVGTSNGQTVEARLGAIATALSAALIRSNHTGLQAISTISGLQDILDARPSMRAIATASEAIAAGSYVNFYNNAGSGAVRNALASNLVRFATGFAPLSIAPGSPGFVISSGLNGATITDPASEVYLSDTTPGAFTYTPPSASGSFIQALGPAVPGSGVFFSQQPRYPL